MAVEAETGAGLETPEPLAPAAPAAEVGRHPWRAYPVIYTDVTMTPADYTAAMMGARGGGARESEGEDGGWSEEEEDGEEDGEWTVVRVREMGGLKRMMMSRGMGMGSACFVGKQLDI